MSGDNKGLSMQIAEWGLRITQMGGQMHGAIATGRAMRPFPKPIREAVALLRADRIMGQWLEWRADDRFINQLEICLVTLGEYKNSERRLWSTWHRDEAAGMQECLRKSGIVVRCGEYFGIDRGRAIELWYMPE